MQTQPFFHRPNPFSTLTAKKREEDEAAAKRVQDEAVAAAQQNKEEQEAAAKKREEDEAAAKKAGDEAVAVAQQKREEEEAAGICCCCAHDDSTSVLACSTGVSCGRTLCAPKCTIPICGFPLGSPRGLRYCWPCFSAMGNHLMGALQARILVTARDTNNQHLQERLKQEKLRAGGRQGLHWYRSKFDGILLQREVVKNVQICRKENSLRAVYKAGKSTTAARGQIWKFSMDYAGPRGQAESYVTCEIVGKGRKKLHMLVYHDELTRYYAESERKMYSPQYEWLPQRGQLFAMRIGGSWLRARGHQVRFVHPACIHIRCNRLYLFLRACITDARRSVYARMHTLTDACLSVPCASVTYTHRYVSVRLHPCQMHSLCLYICESMSHETRSVCVRLHACHVHARHAAACIGNGTWAHPLSDGAQPATNRPGCRYDVHGGSIRFRSLGGPSGWLRNTADDVGR